MTITLMVKHRTLPHKSSANWKRWSSMTCRVQPVDPRNRTEPTSSSTRLMAGRIWH
jgi:hypothetical protein